MKNIENDKWLKELFSEQPEANLSSRFESKLMQRIAVLEVEEAENQKARTRKMELVFGILGSAISVIGIVFAFAFFGWYKPLASSLHELANQFSTMRANMSVVVPIAAIFMLLVADLFARKYLSNK
ncbi:MAG: hypothetical protein BGN96_07665 [Bacteroidales bacterium 45-6]|nr:MAG: hypothetical protein BGN96_07665 [Bacteroidales bacterium 45-6]